MVNRPGSSSKRSLSSDYAFAFMARIVSVGSSAVLAIMTARLLGTAERGVYVLFSTFVTILCTLGNLGFGIGSTFHAGQRTIDVRTLRVNAVVATTLLGGALAIIGYGVAVSWHQMFGAADARLALAAVVGVPLLMGAQFLGAILLGQQLLREYNQLLMVYAAAQLVLVGVACFVFRGVHAAVAAMAGAQLIWFLSTLRATSRWGAGAWNREESVRAARQVFSYGIRGYVGNVVQLLNYRLDFFLVSAMLGPTSLAVYSVAVMIAESLWQLSNSMALVLFPRIAALGGNADEQRRIVGTSARVALATTAVMGLIVASAARYLLVPVFGASYAAAAGTLWWLLPGVVLFAVTVVVSSGIAGLGSPEQTSMVSGTTLILSVGLDLLLIPRMNVAGAALASSLTYTASTLLSVWLYRRLTGTPFSELLAFRRADYLTVRSALRGLVRVRA